MLKNKFQTCLCVKCAKKQQTQRCWLHKGWTHSTGQEPPVECSSAGTGGQKQLLICRGLWRSSAHTLTRTERDPPDGIHTVETNEVTLVRKSMALFPPCSRVCFDSFYPADGSLLDLRSIEVKVFINLFSHKTCLVRQLCCFFVFYSPHWNNDSEETQEKRTDVHSSMGLR